MHALRRISVARRATSSVVHYPKIGSIGAPQAMAEGLAMAATRATIMVRATTMVIATTIVHAIVVVMEMAVTHATPILHATPTLHATPAFLVMVVVHMLPAFRATRVAEHPHAVAQMQEARRAIAHHAVSLRRSGRTM